MRTLTIAAIQTTPVAFDTAASWDRFQSQVHAVRDTFTHVELVVVPELMLAAEAPLLQARADWMNEVAEPIPGPPPTGSARLAKETGLWLVPGSIYERGATGTSTTPRSRCLRSASSPRPTARCSRGSPTSRPPRVDEFVVFDIPGVGRVGLAICYDGSFPETARQLAWLGAEVIIQPTLTTTRDREMELVCARANAWTNQVFVVNVNASDPAGVGASCIVDPEGTVRQQAATGEEVLIDCLDLDAVSRARTHGTFGLNRPWDQLARHGAEVRLPMYGRRASSRRPGTGPIRPEPTACRGPACRAGLRWARRSRR